MIRLELTHNAGLGSLLTVLMSQLIKVPADAAVSIFACSGLYALPGENLFARYFETVPPIAGAVVWRDLPFDGVAHPHNTRLGLDADRVVKLRQLRDRFFRLKPEWSAKAREVIGNRRTLGIHYRGTDKHTEVPRSPRESVFSDIWKLPAHEAYFLTTDEQSAASWFQVHIPDIKLNVHQRTNDARGLHITQGSLQQADETMLDICCLALCDTLLVGRGNFSDMAIVFGETRDIYYQREG